jgi:hypothetical protein
MSRCNIATGSISFIFILLVEKKIERKKARKKGRKKDGTIPGVRRG